MPQQLVDVESTATKSPQPRALIVTIYGLYARQAGGWLSAASLVRLMAELGMDESAVRSSISRLKRRGLLEPVRADGVAGYALSERARTILREGDRRIFERRRAAPGDSWLLAVFSVPETERDKRHLIRSRLSWLGFGTVSSGIWIAPSHVEQEVRDVLQAAGLAEYVDLFRADYLAFRPAAEQVERWWDLAGLEAVYDHFIDEYAALLASWRRRRRPDDAAAFADYVHALTHWRRLPYLDPGLPSELLPANWHGVRAADIFFELKQRLEAAARRHVLEVTGGAPVTTA